MDLSKNAHFAFSVFLDIRKAFDTVNDKILLDKLNHYGIRDEELSFFSSYLHRRTQCCSVNEHKSTFSEITCGGMIVDDKLDKHVDYISSKITRKIGILKRIRHFIPKESLLLLYRTLIEMYFNCSIVWKQCT